MDYIFIRIFSSWGPISIHLCFSSTVSINEDIKRLPEYISSFLQDVSPRKTSSPRGAVGNQKALEQCICLNKRLSLESKTLKQQLNSAENEAAYLTGENESLKKEIEELERGKTLIRCNIFGNIYRMISPIELSVFIHSFLYSFFSERQRNEE